MKSGGSSFEGGSSAKSKTAAGSEYSYPTCVSSLGPNTMPPEEFHSSLLHLQATPEQHGLLLIELVSTR